MADVSATTAGTAWKSCLPFSSADWSAPSTSYQAIILDDWSAIRSLMSQSESRSVMMLYVSKTRYQKLDQRDIVILAAESPTTWAAQAVGRVVNKKLSMDESTYNNARQLHGRADGLDDAKIALSASSLFGFHLSDVQIFADGFKLPRGRELAEQLSFKKTSFDSLVCFSESAILAGLQDLQEAGYDH